MLYKVEARNTQGSLLTLELADISDGYIVSDVRGLDPVKANIVSSKFAQQDGESYQSSRREIRNIVITIELDPSDDTSVFDLRNRLYPFFMPKSEVSLRFYMTNGLTVDIDGRVETMESELFTDEPKVDISIICLDPDFIDSAGTTRTGLLTTDTVARPIDYDGTVDVGAVFTINVLANMSEITIYQTTPSGQLHTLDFASSLIPGDKLVISTVDGNKGATLTRAGVDTSVLYGVSPTSEWIKLEPGTNGIQVYSTATTASTVVLSYTSRYGGL